MYQHLTKLLSAGVVAVALLAFGSTLILAPAWAKPKEDKTTLGDLNCTAGQIAKFVVDAWGCATDDNTDLTAVLNRLLQLEDLVPRVEWSALDRADLAMRNPAS